jgi:xanthine dehydrogenase YagR molybdenum-binding subunit
VLSIDARAAMTLPGVLAVLTHQEAPRLKGVGRHELAVLQSERIAHRGQVVAAVVAATSEIACHAADLVSVAYEAEPHDVVLRADDADLYRPQSINAGLETDSTSGDIELALAHADVIVDATYTTPTQHHCAMEPHAAAAEWSVDGVVVFDADQGPHTIRDDVAGVFGLEPEHVRVVSPYVGGGFGSKGFTHPHVIVAVMASKVVGRPVRLALTRQQTFSLAGHRTPTIQRVQLGAQRDGRLIALAHDVVEHTSTVDEFAEQTAAASRMMYAAPNRRTTHRLARLDVPPPTIMRAPGECPGMFALESAMDELALSVGLDPIELRIRNEPTVDPDTGLPFSSRNLIACLREGALRFGWDSTPRVTGSKREGRWLVGTGVAASTYPARTRAASARATALPDGSYEVAISASDIGTGAWTVLTQIAADALEVRVQLVDLRIGDSDLPEAPNAGGSVGTASWGSAVLAAAEELRRRLDAAGGAVPAEGLVVLARGQSNSGDERFSKHAFGAQFAEVRVDVDTGELRVPRLLGVFACGRVINPKTARSQLIGGMTMGLSMALMEETAVDPQLGMYVSQDLADYHIAVNADVGNVHVALVDEDDPELNPLRAKGIGEIGIVGTAAAIANALHDATGIRCRNLPIHVEDVLGFCV